MRALLRPASRSAEESFSVLHLRTGSFRPLWHAHDEFELNLVVRGAGTRRVGASVEPFGEGDLVLVPPSVAHSWNSAAGGDGPSEAVVATFPASLFDGAPEWRAARGLLEAATTALRFADPGGAIARAMIGLAAMRGGQRLAGLLGVVDLLAQARRTPLGASAAEPVSAGRDEAAVRRAVAELAAAALPPAQAAMAARLGLSPSRFSRAFKRVTGETYRGFVDRLRLDRACALLQRGDLRVGEAAYAAGFANLSNFNRRFLAATGATPRDYRARFLRDMAGVSAPQHSTTLTASPPSAVSL